MRPWVSYTLLRVGLFALIFVVLMLLSVPWWIAALIAAAVGFCVSYIFFRPLRNDVAEEIAEARAGRVRAPGAVPTDEDIEDADRDG
jgi:ABC-type bacteriocin/lantibiotic exporter with double-glycine peptidase domain